MPLLPRIGGKWNATIRTRLRIFEAVAPPESPGARLYNKRGAGVPRRCARSHEETRLDTRNDVLAVLDDVLSLKGRSRAFRDETPLLNGLPELDSMAVANVLASLEERFGFIIDDDEIDGS